MMIISERMLARQVELKPKRLYKRPRTPREKVDISKLTPIVGMPYYADVEGFYIANESGRRINPHLAGRKKRVYRFVLSIDKQRCTLSANRVMYAAIHGISPYQIPDTMVVVRTDEGGATVCRPRENRDARMQNWDTSPRRKT